MKKAWFSLIASLILIIFTAPLNAQQSFTCFDDSVISGAVPLRLAQFDENAEYALTAIGLGDHIPVIASDEQDGFYLCDEGGADDYSVTLPSTGTILPTLANAQWIYPGIDTGDILIGEFESNPGEMVIIIEIVNAEITSHEIQIDVTDSMATSDVPLSVYALGAFEDVDPQLALLDEDSNIVLDETEEPIQCDDWGDSAACPSEVPFSDVSITYFNGTANATETSAALTIPLAEKAGQTLRLQVETNQPGETLLALHLSTGTAAPVATVEATATLDESTGAATLVCDGQTMFENGFQITLAETLTNATVNVVGIDDVVPAMGILDMDDAGTCILPEEETSRYDVQLPSLDANVNLLSGVLAAAQGGQSLVIGDVGEGVGQFLILIEGGNIDAESNDTYTLHLTESMFNAEQPLTTYMLAIEELNPLLAIVDETGSPRMIPEPDTEDPLPVVCDDSGASAVCWNTGVDLSGNFISIANGEQLNTLGVDAMITLPWDSLTTREDLLIQTSASQEDDPMTTGGYVLVLHLALN